MVFRARSWRRLVANQGATLPLVKGLVVAEGTRFGCWLWGYVAGSVGPRICVLALSR